MPSAQLLDAHLVTGSTASGIGAVPGMVLDAGPAGLALLDAAGATVRVWPWRDVDGWEVDTEAAGGGSGRQALTVAARPAPFVVLADPEGLTRFVPALAHAHNDGRRRVAGAARRRAATRAVAVALGALILMGALLAAVSSNRDRPVVRRASVPHPSTGLLAGSVRTRPLHLAKATGAPAPTPPSLAATPLAAHESFGFLPYWTLPDPSSYDLSSLTTIAYFGLDVRADGTVAETATNPGWVGYESQALANVVTEAHHQGTRVVLSATCFDQAALDALTHDPGAQTTLAQVLVGLVRAKNLDGVNLDFEGTGPTDRAGLDQLVATVSRALAAADPAWQFTVDTYASSASDPKGFYDVAGMAPSVDAFVPMDYDMGATFAAGPTAAPGSSSYTDQEVISSYSAVAGPQRVILALPLYGEDWPTVGPTAGDPATGPPTPVADAQITPADTVYWDPQTTGPWAVYRAGRQWHQIWFDDPASLAAKAQRARAAGLRGVALWALGMAPGTGDQRAAFTGIASTPQPPDGPVTLWTGPVPTWATPSGSPAAPGTDARSATVVGAFGSSGTSAPKTATPPPAEGIYAGSDVSLVGWPGVPPAATTPAGSLAAFSSSGPSVACLSHGPPLLVVQIDGTSAYLVEARAPADCASATWAFVLPAGTARAPGTPGASAGQGARGAASGTTPVGTQAPPTTASPPGASPTTTTTAPGAVSG